MTKEMLELELLALERLKLMNEYADVAERIDALIEQKQQEIAEFEESEDA